MACSPHRRTGKQSRRTAGGRPRPRGHGQCQCQIERRARAVPCATQVGTVPYSKAHSRQGGKRLYGQALCCFSKRPSNPVHITLRPNPSHSARLEGRPASDSYFLLTEFQRENSEADMARAIWSEPSARHWEKSSGPSRAAPSTQPGYCEIRCQAVKGSIDKGAVGCVGGEKDEELLLCRSTQPNPTVLNSPVIVGREDR